MFDFMCAFHRWLETLKFMFIMPVTVRQLAYLRSLLRLYFMNRFK
jgi:hypothetical protein